LGSYGLTENVRENVSIGNPETQARNTEDGKPSGALALLGHGLRIGLHPALCDTEDGRRVDVN
jgi:hypothetical protein